jgi:hypothetical protein
MAEDQSERTTLIGVVIDDEDSSWHYNVPSTATTKNTFIEHHRRALRENLSYVHMDRQPLKPEIFRDT